MLRSDPLAVCWMALIVCGWDLSCCCLHALVLHYRRPQRRAPRAGILAVNSHVPSLCKVASHMCYLFMFFFHWCHRTVQMTREEAVDTVCMSDVDLGLVQLVPFINMLYLKCKVLWIIGWLEYCFSDKIVDSVLQALEWRCLLCSPDASPSADSLADSPPKYQRKTDRQAVNQSLVA